MHDDTLWSDCFSGHHVGLFFSNHVFIKNTAVNKAAVKKYWVQYASILKVSVKSREVHYIPFISNLNERCIILLVIGTTLLD